MHSSSGPDSVTHRDRVVSMLCCNSTAYGFALGRVTLSPFFVVNDWLTRLSRGWL
jgi:hypothetical protein